MRHLEVSRRVKVARCETSGLEETGLKFVALRARAVPQNFHFAGFVGGDSQRHFAFAAMPDSGEHLLARQDQFDRTPDFARGQNAQDFVRPDADAFAAKAAAGEVTNHAHALFGHLENDNQ